MNLVDFCDPLTFLIATSRYRHPLIYHDIFRWIYTDIHCPQRMNPCDLVASVTFPLVSLFVVLSEFIPTAISLGCHEIVDIQDPQRMIDGDFSDFSNTTSQSKCLCTGIL